MIVVPRRPAALKADLFAGQSQRFSQVRLDKDLADTPVLNKGLDQQACPVPFQRIGFPQALHRRQIPAQADPAVRAI